MRFRVYGCSIGWATAICCCRVRRFLSNAKGKPRTATSRGMSAMESQLRPGRRRRTTQTSVHTYCDPDYQSRYSFSALPLITPVENDGDRGDRDDSTICLMGRHCSSAGLCQGRTREVLLSHCCAPPRSSVYHIRIWPLFQLQISGYVPAMVTPAHRLSTGVSL